MTTGALLAESSTLDVAPAWAHLMSLKREEGGDRLIPYDDLLLDIQIDRMSVDVQKSVMTIEVQRKEIDAELGTKTLSIDIQTKNKEIDNGCS